MKFLKNCIALIMLMTLFSSGFSQEILIPPDEIELGFRKALLQILADRL